MMHSQRLSLVNDKNLSATYCVLNLLIIECIAPSETIEFNIEESYERDKLQSKERGF